MGVCVPFKKNSENKTMNVSFLKRVFGNRLFVKDYLEFLGRKGVI